MQAHAAQVRLPQLTVTVHTQAQERDVNMSYGTRVAEYHCNSHGQRMTSHCITTRVAVAWQPPPTPTVCQSTSTL